MKKLTNNKGIPLVLAVWLGDDNYAYDSRPNVISVTTLLKSVRQIILSRRLPIDTASTQDVSERIAAALGQALHSSVEHTWLTKAPEILKALGFPLAAINKIVINPEPAQIKPDSICIYFEKRSERQLGKWIVSGQFDIAFKGIPHDVKSTSVDTYVTGRMNDKYISQMSYYRWLNPSIITADYGIILYIFKDFVAKFAGSKNYPSAQLYPQQLDLLSLPLAEMQIQTKLDLLDFFWNDPEPELPLCTADDLWQKPSLWKVYKNTGSKKAMRGGIFTDPHSANAFAANTAGSDVREIPGKPVACLYCNCRSICSQYANFVTKGVL